jgi:hypothetical protein
MTNDPTINPLTAPRPSGRSEGPPAADAPKHEVKGHGEVPFTGSMKPPPEVP